MSEGMQGGYPPSTAVYNAVLSALEEAAARASPDERQLILSHGMALYEQVRFLPCHSKTLQPCQALPSRFNPSKFLSPPPPNSTHMMHACTPAGAGTGPYALAVAYCRSSATPSDPFT
jgi:hypothetical protein